MLSRPAAYSTAVGRPVSVETVGGEHDHDDTEQGDDDAVQPDRKAQQRV